MKFEREIPIGLDARRKKRQGGGQNAPHPNGIRVNQREREASSKLEIIHNAIVFIISLTERSTEILVRYL